jgi:hypothetical protein
VVRSESTTFLKLTNFLPKNNNILSSSQNVRRLSLIKSQYLLSLTKFIQKNMNIYKLGC